MYRQRSEGRGYLHKDTMTPLLIYLVKLLCMVSFRYATDLAKYLQMRGLQLAVERAWLIPALFPDGTFNNLRRPYVETG